MKPGGARRRTHALTDEELLFNCRGRKLTLTFDERVRAQTLRAEAARTRLSKAQSNTLDSLLERLGRVQRELAMINGIIRLHEKVQAQDLGQLTPSADKPPTLQSITVGWPRQSGHRS